MDRQKLRIELIRDEGLRLKAYKDSLGNFTIGVGHLMPLTATGAEMITEARAMDLLETDIDIAYSLATEVFGIMVEMADARQRALVNMCLNLGNRIRGFKKLIAAVRAGQWDLAAAEALDSKWADQVGKRATRIADMLRHGEVSGG